MFDINIYIYKTIKQYGNNITITEEALDFISKILYTFIYTILKNYQHMDLYNAVNDVFKLNDALDYTFLANRISYYSGMAVKEYGKKFIKSKRKEWYLKQSRLTTLYFNILPICQIINHLGCNKYTDEFIIYLTCVIETLTVNIFMFVGFNCNHVTKQSIISYINEDEELHNIFINVFGNSWPNIYEFKYKKINVVKDGIIEYVKIYKNKDYSEMKCIDIIMPENHTDISNLLYEDERINLENDKQSYKYDQHFDKFKEICRRKNYDFNINETWKYYKLYDDNNCFALIEKNTGDIFKPTKKCLASNIKGNIFNEDNGLSFFKEV